MADTIAAIATGQSLAAIGIIRLSGDDTLSVIDRVFFPASGKKMSDCGDRRLIYGEMRSPEGDTLDLCLCTVSRAPSSYTGETTAELQCHGSPVVLRAGLEALFAAGARQALAGEFTKRAFLNGRMDLTQAEAVIDLIHAGTEEAAKNAAGQIGGAVRRKTDVIYDELAAVSAHYHAVIDYPDEDIEEFDADRYRPVLEGVRTQLEGLAASFSRGRIMREGVPAAIVGRPNAGKSSLLNALLGYDRAIVASVPGTTRDTIEERLTLGGVLLRLTDTAGLRETGDELERLGVERSRSALSACDLAIIVIDGSQEMTAEDEEILREAKKRPRHIVVLSKADLSGKCAVPGALRVSARTGEGLERLGELIASLYPVPETPAGEIITNARQFDAVSRALESILAALGAMDMGFMPDMILSETESAMSALGELSGKTVREDVTAKIFERFCVGK